MKIVSLDLGDAKTGIAISDVLGITARPLETVATRQLEQFLKSLFLSEPIKTVVVGYPQTLRATESIQTKKVVVAFENLQELFKDVSWILWDERLSSKHALRLRSQKSKHSDHAIAAAIILTSYLEFLQQKNNEHAQ